MAGRRLTAEQRAKIFKALSDPKRVDIVDALVGGSPMCGTALADALGVSLALVCHHWEVLVEAGVLRKERVGQLRVCSLDVERIREALQGWGLVEPPPSTATPAAPLGPLPFLSPSAEPPPPAKASSRKALGAEPPPAKATAAAKAPAKATAKTPAKAMATAPAKGTAKTQAKGAAKTPAKAMAQTGAPRPRAAGGGTRATASLAQQARPGAGAV